MQKPKNKRQVPARKPAPRLWLRWAALFCLIAIVGIAAFALLHRRPTETATVHASSPAPAGGMTGSFGPTIPNTKPSPAQPPKGMVWIPGGEFSMGAQEAPMEGAVGMQATTDSRPIHRVYVDGFYMDKTDVTNAQFAAFVKATGYVTIAEKAPTAEEYPTAPPENLVAGSVVFAPPKGTRPAQ